MTLHVNYNIPLKSHAWQQSSIKRPLWAANVAITNLQYTTNRRFWTTDEELSDQKIWFTFLEFVSLTFHIVSLWECNYFKGKIIEYWINVLGGDGLKLYRLQMNLNRLKQIKLLCKTTPLTSIGKVYTRIATIRTYHWWSKLRREEGVPSSLKPKWKFDDYIFIYHGTHHQNYLLTYYKNTGQNQNVMKYNNKYWLPITPLARPLNAV